MGFAGSFDLSLSKLKNAIRNKKKPVCLLEDNVCPHVCKTYWQNNKTTLGSSLCSIAQILAINLHLLNAQCKPELLKLARTECKLCETLKKLPNTVGGMLVTKSPESRILRSWSFYSFWIKYRLAAVQGIVWGDFLNCFSWHIVATPSQYAAMKTHFFIF